VDSFGSTSWSLSYALAWDFFVNKLHVDGYSILEFYPMEVMHSFKFVRT